MLSAERFLTLQLPVVSNEPWLNGTRQTAFQEVEALAGLRQRPPRSSATADCVTLSRGRPPGKGSFPNVQRLLFATVQIDKLGAYIPPNRTLTKS
jgi:hypothetical protein